MPAALSDQTRRLIVDLRRTGRTYRECAVAAGCSEQTVHRVVAAAGLTGHDDLLDLRRERILARLEARLAATPIRGDGCAIWQGRPFITVAPALRDLPGWETGTEGATHHQMRVARAALIIYEGWGEGYAGHTCRGGSLCIHPDHLAWMLTEPQRSS